MDPRLVHENAVNYDSARCLCGVNTFTGHQEQQQQQHKLESVAFGPSSRANTVIYLYARLGDCLQSKIGISNRITQSPYPLALAH